MGNRLLQSQMVDIQEKEGELASQARRRILNGRDGKERSFENFVFAIAFEF